jgi:hypothetical protein
MSFSTPLKSLIVAAVLGAGFASVAYAQGQVVTAKLVTPVAAITHVAADNAVWTCQGDTCQAQLDHASTVRDCRQLQHLTGPLSAFGADSATLNDQEIARCNGQATTQTAQSTTQVAH